MEVAVTCDLRAHVEFGQQRLDSHGTGAQVGVLVRGQPAPNQSETSFREPVAVGLRPSVDGQHVQP